jgi:hypothetical protein
MDRLNAQHYSSRGMPSQMLGQTLSGLLTMGRDAYGQISGGMNQYYGTQNNPANRVNYGGILGQLASGYQDSSRNIGGAQRDLMGGFGTTMSAFPGYSRDMRSAFDTTRGDINANTGRLEGGFSAANSNVGSVLGALTSGFGAASKAMSDLYGSSIGDFFAEPTTQESQMKKLQDDVFNYRRAGWRVPTHISDMLNEVRRGAI